MNIIGTGIDIVQVSRIQAWIDQGVTLEKVFSAKELADCTHQGALQAQRLAARFATKEAFFKALSAALVHMGATEHQFGIGFVCANTQVVSGEWDVPVLQVNWDAWEERFGEPLPPFAVQISLSHEKEYAVATVLVGD